MELNTIHNCDALSGLKLVSDESVDCIVTSPPYWQMRDYGIGGIIWPDGWCGQLGQEPTRDDFIEHLCLIFDECRRVLKPTGTLWVNLGDSYSKPYKYNRRQDPKWSERTKNSSCLMDMQVDTFRHRIPSKSLCNIPNKFADEMILRGWVLRNEIIWHKPPVYPPASTTALPLISKSYFSLPKAAVTILPSSSRRMPTRLSSVTKHLLP